jgi:hypothetical protein
MRPALALSLLLAACGDPAPTGYVPGVDPRCPAMQGFPPAPSPVPDACYYQCAASASRCSADPSDAGLTVVYCVDTQTDRRNCGSCRNACPSGQACVAGACR